METVCASINRQIFPHLIRIETVPCDQLDAIEHTSVIQKKLS
jgi:hypothetical protein